MTLQRTQYSTLHYCGRPPSVRIRTHTVNTQKFMRGKNMKINKNGAESFITLKNISM